MDYGVTFRKAALMGISPQAAARMRIRFLNEETHRLMPFCKAPVAALWCNKNMEEILYLIRRMQEVFVKTSAADRINDADIESAKLYPLKELIEFRNGVALAFCHMDKRPSLYYASRINKAVCPVCNKYFNAIDVLMERDKFSFIEAVKQLRS